MAVYTATGLPKVEFRPLPPQLAEYAAELAQPEPSRVLPVASTAVRQVAAPASPEVSNAHPSRRGKAADDGGRLVLLTITGQRPEWQGSALCAQTDPEAFFPEKGGSTREGKRICGHCEVKSECLDQALATDEKWGIWGGLSERERRRLKRRAV